MEMLTLLVRVLSSPTLLNLVKKLFTLVYFVRIYLHYLMQCIAPMTNLKVLMVLLRYRAAKHKKTLNGDLKALTSAELARLLRHSITFDNASIAAREPTVLL